MLTKTVSLNSFIIYFFFIAFENDNQVEFLLQGRKEDIGNGSDLDANMCNALEAISSLFLLFVHETE